MSTNDPTGGKSSASRRGDEQIVHGLCHDCPEYEELYRAEHAADAIQAAIEDAIEHARATGHENVDHKLLTEPDLEVCEDCEEPIQARVDGGPTADDAHSPCGCTPVSGE